MIKEHDFVIRVIEHEDVSRVETGVTVAKSEPCKVHEFKVKRDALINSGDYFRKLFAYDDPTEPGQNTIDLKEDSATAMTVWFKLFHDTVDDTTYQASISDIWQLLETAHKYGFDPKSEVATAWFAKWYDVKTRNHERGFDYKEHAMLLFPCHTFDHAQGFRAATKYMVYRATGHIVERRPVGFTREHLRLDPVILRESNLCNIMNFVAIHCTNRETEQLNAAKGRLKTILHRVLYTPIDQLLKNARCNCKAQVLYAYEQGLTNTGAWPLESGLLSNSIERILKYLEDFPLPGAFIPQTCGARFCSFDFVEVVRNARMECKRYFDGLCLGKSGLENWTSLSL